MITLTPFSANLIAVASPIPEVAPVIKAVLYIIINMVVIFHNN